MKNFKYFFISLLTVFVFLGLSAQETDPGKTIPVDPAIKVGKLDNGLTYYIKQNKKPEQRMELRLAVNAGSMQESDFQKGLAQALVSPAALVLFERERLAVGPEIFRQRPFRH